MIVLAVQTRGRGRHVGSEHHKAVGSRFELYLRTGRTISRPAAQAAVEVKFNPWHDPENGRFTFAGMGRYYRGGGSGSRGDSAATGNPGYEHFHPQHPRNHTIHLVRRGDTLTRIAALRKGLRVSDLAWLNRISPSATLRIGQKLMLPTQAYLEEGRRALSNYNNLRFYMDTHGDRLPPDLRNIPSIQEQLDSGWRRVVKNGYEFHVDVISRTRRIRGWARLDPAQRRSRQAQAAAGGADRRASDDGGHYIAARFGGPPEIFNHFAQDANFNRGAYRALEDRWANHLKAGRKVFVDIFPHFGGISNRPSKLEIYWYVDGRRFRSEFSNQPKGK